MRSGAYFFLLYFLLFGVLVTGERLLELSFRSTDVDSSEHSSVTLQKSAGCFFSAAQEAMNAENKINYNNSSGKFSQRGDFK